MRKIRRPYRFVTFGIFISVVTIFIFNALLDTGLLLNTKQGHFIGWIAGASAVLLAIGLAGSHYQWADRFVHYGLLAATFAWVTRTVFIGLSDGLAAFAFWFSCAWVVIIVGTIMLELYDPARRVSDGTSEIRA